VNISIDPGKLGGPKLLFCHQTDANQWRIDSAPPVGVFEIAAAEGQIPNPKWGRQGLMTLAGGGMAALFAVDAALRLVLPPRIWKGKLIDNGGALPKAVACRNLKRLLRMPDDLDPEDDADQDVIDAIGIHAAIAKLKAKELKQYAVGFLQADTRLFLRR
jgi:hypothetical protein